MFQITISLLLYLRTIVNTYLSTLLYLLSVMLNFNVFKWNWINMVLQFVSVSRIFCGCLYFSASLEPILYWQLHTGVNGLGSRDGRTDACQGFREREHTLQYFWQQPTKLIKLKLSTSISSNYKRWMKIYAQAPKVERTNNLN